mgnify:CR=1 FL=1
MKVIKNKLHIQALEYQKTDIVPIENDYLVRIVFDGMIIELVLSKAELIDLTEDLLYGLKMIVGEELCGERNL